ncbi:MAG TPA: KEOPS complex subunit Pcc1 [Methanocorpusculum sp.]|nr:KEOPS complex subunit Pcc1 [Methanocorpusculum sp.]HJJ55165.1 KEOPS complex subunit Pcc1 [Methanocorpusculum sp.]
MKITGVITSKTDAADKIAEALSPDNAGYMQCSAEGNTVKAEVEGTSPRTVLATVDDYLMNLSVAWQVHESASRKTTNK